MATAELMTVPPNQDNGLVPIQQNGGQLTRDVAGAQASAITEAKGRMMMAKQFPRNEDDCFQKLMRSCKRFSFADGCRYSFRRGSSVIQGPSVKLARESARIWGNIAHGLEVVRDTNSDRHIRGWAWDLETNAFVSAEDDFQKMIQRKQKDGRTLWVPADERELRELTNRRGAILVRNSLLQLLPPDLVEDAMRESAATVEKGMKDDPEKHRKAILLAFDGLGVPASELEKFVGKSIKQLSAADLVHLRETYTSIRDGQTTWKDLTGQEDDGKEKKSVDDVKKKAASKNSKPAPDTSADAHDPGETISPDQLDMISTLVEQKGLGQLQLDSLVKKVGGTAMLNLSYTAAKKLIEVLKGKPDAGE